MKSEKIKTRQEDLARIEKVSSIEKKVLDLDPGKSRSFDKLDALTMMNIRTRMSRSKETLGIIFRTEISGSTMTITREDNN